jgi:hypothetical protein
MISLGSMLSPYFILAADVVACGDCKVVSIDRMSFTRLLGTLPARTYL